MGGVLLFVREVASGCGGGVWCVGFGYQRVRAGLVSRIYFCI